MPFTPITITADEVRPDGQPASGTLTAMLSEAMRNGSERVDPTPISALFAAGALTDSSGEQPLVLLATDDAGTSTESGRPAVYQFVVALDGAPLDTFTAVLSHSTTPVSLDSLRP